MKKEKIKELLNELIEREFQIDEISDLFSHVKDYLSAKKESEREEEDEDYRKFHAVSVPTYRKWLQRELEVMGLDYSIGDFEEDF